LRHGAPSSKNQKWQTLLLHPGDARVNGKPKVEKILSMATGQKTSDLSRIPVEQTAWQWVRSSFGHSVI
jgi:hypothetical protein